MKRMYRTEGNSISSIEVIKETPKQVTYMGMWCGSPVETREAKKSTYQNWHDSWEIAREFLICVKQKKLNNMMVSAEKLQSEIDSLLDMQSR